MKSTYFGAVEAGTLMASMVAFERGDRDAEQDHLRGERREFDPNETTVSELFDGVQHVADGMRDDPEFIAGLNRAKLFRRERLRADVLSLASDAMATLRELVSGPDVPPSVRLRASLAILDAADALKGEEIGPTSAEAVEAKMDHQRFIDSLG